MRNSSVSHVLVVCALLVYGCFFMLAVGCDSSHSRTSLTDPDAIFSPPLDDTADGSDDTGDGNSGDGSDETPGDGSDEDADEDPDGDPDNGPDEDSDEVSGP